MSAFSRLFLLLVVLIAAWVVADGIGVRKLANTDEGRYSEISREMAASGDFVTPRLNDLKYLKTAAAVLGNRAGLSRIR